MHEKEGKKELWNAVRSVLSLSRNGLLMVPIDRGEDLPLSFAQQRLWFLAQLEPCTVAYNMSTAFQLTGLLNVTVLEQSIVAIVNRHEVLRTTFLVVDGQPRQVIAEKVAWKLPIINFEEIPLQQREAEAQRYVAQQTQQPFDLAKGPLWDFQLLRLAKDSHVLHLNIHHIIFDQWSLGLFLQELATLYKAFLYGEPSPLPPLPIQYVDFAHWQRQWLSGEVLANQLNYWKQQLAGIPPLLELSSNRSRPARQSFQSSKQQFDFNPHLTNQIKTLSQQSGVTLFMTLLAAFATLLSRYSGQEDIVVGSPIANRNRSEIKSLIGFFTNTLALRIDLSGNPSFRELLHRVQQVALGAYTHQSFPFDKLVEELHPERSLSHTPIFQVWFNMLNFTESRFELSKLKVEYIPALITSYKFDFTLYIEENYNKIFLQLVYRTALFKSEFMLEMLAQYKHLLEQISENSEEKITNYSLVTTKAKLVLPSPTQTRNSEWSIAVHTRFTQQARKVPQNLAVVDTQKIWSYAELEEHTNQIANYLLENGIDKDDVVAIYGQRSGWLVVAVLGILKAGAAFVILDPAYPENRLIDCLSVVSPRGWLEITDVGEIPNALKEFVTTSSFHCYLQLPQSLILTTYSTKNPEIEIDPDNLAYVAFTSGSTGKPQAILGTHRPLSHFFQWHCQTFGLNQSDRFTLLSGLSHDPLLRDIFTPLWLGATLCIPEQQNIETGGELAVWMQQQKVSIAHLTPAMGQIITETTSTITQLPQLRYVFFSGDCLTRYDVTRIKSIAPTATCVNFYGATETPQVMGYFIIPNQEDKVEDAHSASITNHLPLGKGIEDVQLLILNATQQLAGIGELGEIYVRTPYLSKGYLNNHQLTKERFITNPFTNINSDQLYKTGDLARYLSDGNIEFCGRLDNQVKIRGFRIELGEVETAIAHHPSVQQTIVTARVDESSDKRLVAYIVLKPQHKPTIDEFHRFLKQKLPEYMVPSAFVFLDTFPLTPNGKIDRNALPTPDSSRPKLEETLVAPRTEVEQQIADIWVSLLKLEKIGIHDNFFTLGGHSLLATQVIARLRAFFGIDLPVRTLFEAPTVALLADRIETVQWVTQQSQVDIMGNYEEGEL
ncbi:amino acid adenylation domain-containing protein [uncultured Nostoc sp.]|uniref:non-ribosomal peptide synthetase n=1 Tax=uncultured Nostoc sp. TaxID=340711 RepID=UPI0035CC58EA